MQGTIQEAIEFLQNLDQNCQVSVSLVQNPTEHSTSFKIIIKNIPAGVYVGMIRFLRCHLPVDLVQSKTLVDNLMQAGKSIVIDTVSEHDFNEIMHELDANNVEYQALRMK